MRTNIEIDDLLMASAMRLSGRPTKRETVELALRRMVRQLEAHEALMALKGKIDWDGDLDAMRRDKSNLREEW